MSTAYSLAPKLPKLKSSSKATNAQSISFILSKYFSCNIYKMKMASVVPHHGMKPHCIYQSVILSAPQQNSQLLSEPDLLISVPYNFLF